MYVYYANMQNLNEKNYLKQQNSFLNCLSANRTAINLITTHLASAMPTKEYHILDPVETHGTHGLKMKHYVIKIQ